ncbi:Alginate lyase [Duganella sp. CF402]|uniref:putative Ig domain-containing protein n=1 Tax=unclassified Duganella TaxID=2636909 RepID=UPI0008C2EB87|nr:MULTISPECIES: putative Ig domain-containing protein [unclassified Duganella]RZT06203.1 alginate lyase [Duganella sp. BK701]SEM72239.1 Alginate lyase [Duganella sp. CF402]
MNTLSLRGVSAAVAAALLWLAATPAGAIAFVATPQAQPSVSAAGFKHPALGFTLEQLEYARQQVRADVEPYKTYYNTLATVCCNYASLDLQPTNRDASKVDTPNTPNYNNGTGQTRMINDSQGALTQAILYYMTGKNEHRRNAMRILRTWSNMNPNGYAYFPDAHIHNGVPLFRMLMAAEIMRYTPADTTYAAYPLAWTATDTQKLKDNLIDPMERTFFASNERFMNQHVYSIAGRLAGAIFTDNRARYDETVEWLTVNASSTRQDINGGILPLIPLIGADNPLNTAGYPFYQIQEMMRDQAHGGDNVDNLIGLLRLVNSQGTKVDPYTGKPSMAGDAVSVYHFGDNRLLMGANSYAQFMLGYKTPWADTTGGSSGMSEAYRGRLYAAEGIAEIYNVYKYEQGVDVDTVAPYLATAASHQNGYVTPWGRGTPDNKDFGAEAFITLPKALTGKPLPPNTGMLETERKTIYLNGDWSTLTEGDRTFGRGAVTPSGATVVFHDIVYADRSKYAPVGLMIRTNAVTKLAASGTEDGKPWCEMTVPNTEGQWRYIVPDASTAATGARKLGDNIIYFKFSGAEGANVDVDFVNLNAPTQLTPPRFAMPVFPVTEFVVQGMAYRASYTAIDANAADTVSYKAINVPAGASVDSATGTLSWTPTPDQVGEHDLIISATDGVAISTMTARLNVQPDRQAAFLAAQGGYDGASAYTTPSLAAFKAEIAPLQQAVASTADADFPALLKKVQAVVQKLELLNPRLASDGSLDWSKNMVAATVLNAANIPGLLDDDYNTTSGDLRDVVTLDFGENYRVAASAFGIRPRFMFGNRTQGINVYGSNDSASWTVLTSRETTDTSGQNFIMETIPVVPGQEDQKYRYFMIRVDHPGPPTDPAYPGISSYSELHFYGSRYDLLAPVDVSASVKMLQSGLSVNRFTQKYSGTVTITNTTQQAIKGPLQFTLEYLTAGVTLDNASGVKDGVPYITLPAADLAPGQSVTLTTTFSNPSKLAISYGRKLLSAKY